LTHDDFGPLVAPALRARTAQRTVPALKMLVAGVSVPGCLNAERWTSKQVATSALKV